MIASDIRECAFKRLKEIGRSTAADLAALLCVPTATLIGALGASGDFRRIAGVACWDWALDAFAECREDEAATAEQNKAARRSAADYAKESAAIWATNHSSSPEIEKVVEVIRQRGPCTVKQISEWLAWRPSRVAYSLRRNSRLLSMSTPTVGGSRAFVWSLRRVPA